MEDFSQSGGMVFTMPDITSIPVELLPALRLVADERLRQMEVEGYTIEHDRAHGHVYLRDAAKAYEFNNFKDWPWNLNEFKTTNLFRDLIKAGSLYAAAFDATHPTSVSEFYRDENVRRVCRKLTGIIDGVKEAGL